MSADRPPHESSDDAVTDAVVHDPTAIPSPTPYAPQYGTPGELDRPGVDPAPLAVRPAGGGLSKRTATFVTALSPFVALIGFFALMNAGVGQAWLAFLLVPITGLVTEQLRGDKKDTPR